MILFWFGVILASLTNEGRTYTLLRNVCDLLRKLKSKPSEQQRNKYGDLPLQCKSYQSF